MSNDEVRLDDILVRPQHLPKDTPADLLRWRRTADMVASLMLHPKSCHYDWPVAIEPFGDRMATKSRTGALLCYAAKCAGKRAVRAVHGGTGMHPRLLQDGGLIGLARDALFPDGLGDTKDYRSRVRSMVVTAAEFPLLRGAATTTSWRNAFGIGFRRMVTSACWALLALDSASLKTLAGAPEESVIWDRLSVLSEASLSSLVTVLAMPPQGRMKIIRALIAGSENPLSMPLPVAANLETLSHNDHGIHFHVFEDGHFVGQLEFSMSSTESTLSPAHSPISGEANEMPLGPSVENALTLPYPVFVNSEIAMATQAIAVHMVTDSYLLNIHGSKPDVLRRMKELLNSIRSYRKTCLNGGIR